MSRNMLTEELEGVGSRDGNPSYTEGSSSSYATIVHTLVSSFQEGGNTSTISQRVHGLATTYLEETEQVDPNALLTEIVDEYSWRARKNDEWSLDALFTPVLRALYEHDYNGFHLDISGLERQPMRIVSALWGNEERPLELVCVGDVFFFGSSMGYCHLELFGNAYSVANSSHYSDVIIHGEVSSRAGDRASNCTFELQSVQGVSTSGRNSDCSYYVENPTKGHLSYIRKRKMFYEKGNKLLVPDEDNPGEWKEVRP